MNDHKYDFDYCISIHALRGEGDLFLFLRPLLRVLISIHALRGEGDYTAANVTHRSSVFQSTPSVGRATSDELEVVGSLDISIHALRGEGDAECRKC